MFNQPKTDIMKKIVLFLVVLITGTLQAQIKVGVNNGKPIVEFPGSKGDFKKINFYEYANDKFGKVIDPKNIVEESVFTESNCAEEKTVDLGTGKGGKLKYKLDCNDDTNKVTFYLGSENGTNKVVLYFTKKADPQNPRFVREGISIIKGSSGAVIFSEGEEFNEINLYKDGTFNDIEATIKPEMFGSDSNKEIQLGNTEGDKITYDIKGKTICFKDSGPTPETCFELKDNMFIKKESDTSVDNRNNTLLRDFPLFGLVKNDSIYCNKNRVLVIDANPRTTINGNNTGLKKITRKKKENKGGNENKGDSKNKDLIVKSVYALPNKGYLSVAINSYRFHRLESFDIEINGDNYSYEDDIKSLMKLLQDSESINGVSDLREPNDKEIKPKSPLAEYLDNVYDTLKTYKFINLNDLYEVAKYKKELEEYYKDNKKEFDVDALQVKSKIMAWYPENVSLTPIPIDVPAKDEVEIKYTLKNEGTNAVKKSLGTFRTMGKFSVDYGAALFYTNLVNNNIYKDTRIITPATDTQPAVTETKAKMDDNKQGSFGLGINLDMSYRTGSELRPTLNFGFFVPLEEDITPYATGGLGVGIFGKDYKVNFSYGLAVGKVNAIKDRYNDVDITGMELEESDLIEKRVKFGYYFALAVSFNLGR